MGKAALIEYFLFSLKFSYSLVFESAHFFDFFVGIHIRGLNMLEIRIQIEFLFPLRLLRFLQRRPRFTVPLLLLADRALVV